MKLPSTLLKLAENFENLPNIGPKSALRLAFFVLKQPKGKTEEFANSLINVVNNLKFCDTCHNISESSLCTICTNKMREQDKLCVVENVLDIVAIEQTGFSGLYHCLGGVLNPLNGVNVDDLYISDLITRVKRLSEVGKIELILATNPTVEGESTAMYIKRQVETLPEKNNITITRIGRGLPTGGDIEFADKITLDNSLSSRVVY